MFYKIKQDNLYVILVDVDNELKRESELLFDNLWLDINEAVILFLETTIKNSDIPFPYKLNDNNLSKISDAVIKKYIDAYKELAKWIIYLLILL